ncbi:SGNH/GDSL hydrolase family protein [Sulfitobacter sp. D35]|uniref:SGNH/GDSL hydrolase family protein n=1 Tax=Sulfitobacter sp. D35 TaxID=3083252 RepID=UPI00296E7EFB|nr:SGNH/GDSL hydrolase family protein [Sulfitobacter sp. D35]MDW4500037.1 SGNH/GDSL hydrolase family protein [Sulfitobacter sp. D35]
MPVVMCFGDSNTHGTMPMERPGALDRLGPEARWPGVMAQALGVGWTVIEEGQPGRTTVHDDPIEGAWKNGAAVLPALLDTHRPVDLVVIMLGTNDLKARFSVTASDIADSAARLAALVRASIAGPGGAAPAVLLVAPPKIEEAGALASMFAGGAAKSSGLGQAFARVADRFGIPLFDAATVAAPDPLDGIHLSEDTHRALGAALADKVADILR